MAKAKERYVGECKREGVDLMLRSWGNHIIEPRVGEADGIWHIWQVKYNHAKDLRKAIDRTFEVARDHSHDLPPL